MVNSGAEFWRFAVKIMIAEAETNWCNLAELFEPDFEIFALSVATDSIEIINEIAGNRDEGRGLFACKNEGTMHVGRRAAVEMNVA